MIEGAKRGLALGCGALVAAGVIALAGRWVWHGTPGASNAGKFHVPRSFSGEFIANPGLFGSRVSYWSRTSLGDTYVLDDGRLLHALPAEPEQSQPPRTRRIWAIVETLAPAGRFAASSAVRDGRYTYFGHRAHSAVPIQHYETLNLARAWPGIDLKLRQTATGIERVYTVQPGADPGRILISLDGAGDARISRRGDLTLTTGVGEVRFARPVAYQVDGYGKRTDVPVGYRVRADGSSFGFTVGRYDDTLPLLIDPVLQGTYLGDGASQSIYAMAIDPRNGDVLVTGEWYYGVPPEVYGGFQTTGQVSEIFITRADAKLERVIHSTVLGGSTAEDAMALAVDPNSGDVFVGGAAASPDFPGGGGSDEPTLPPGTLGVGFVSRLSSDLHRLEQTSYFSANLGSTFAWGIAVSPQTSDVYVVGADVGGAVVTRYNENLTHILSRYVLQGNVSEGALGVAINPTNGDVYVTGITHSWTFPKIAGGAFSSSTHPAVYNFERVFVARLDASLSTHLQSTYLWDGNANEFHAFRIPVTVDARTGDVIVAAASNGDLGVISGGAQTSFAGGNTDALIVRFSADLRLCRASCFARLSER